MNDSFIQIKQISKHFGNVKAVDGISFKADSKNNLIDFKNVNIFFVTIWSIFLLLDFFEIVFNIISILFLSTISLLYLL